MGGMSEKELQDFFSSEVRRRLGCLDDAGAPDVVPRWFQYAGGGFYIVPRARSALANDLQRNGRVFLCIDAETGRRALVKSVAELVKPMSGTLGQDRLGDGLPVWR